MKKHTQDDYISLTIGWKGLHMESQNGGLKELLILFWNVVGGLALLILLWKLLG